MTTTTTEEKTEKPDVDAAASAGAAAMSKKRWATVSPEERTRIATWVASQGAGRPRTKAKRCPCGAMTLKLAKFRGGATGTSLGHKPGCRFYRDHKLKIR